MDATGRLTRGVYLNERRHFESWWSLQAPLSCNINSQSMNINYSSSSQPFPIRGSVNHQWIFRRSVSLSPTLNTHLYFQPWRWRKYVYSKSWYLPITALLQRRQKSTKTIRLIWKIHLSRLVAYEGLWFSLFVIDLFRCSVVRHATFLRRWLSSELLP